MASIVIKPRSREEEEFLTELLKKMNVESHLIEEPVPNYTTIKAMKEVESKAGNRVNNSDELISQLGL
jgi:hypothetical protein